MPGTALQTWFAGCPPVTLRNETLPTTFNSAVRCQAPLRHLGIDVQLPDPLNSFVLCLGARTDSFGRFKRKRQS